MKQTLHTSRRAIRLALLCLMAFVTWGGNYCIAQETASLAFTKAPENGKATDTKNMTWSVSSDGAFFGCEKVKGLHYGSGKKTVSFIKVSTSAYAEAVITKIVVNASTANGVEAKVKCEVGGAAFGVEKKLTSSNAPYTFEGSASGNILVSVYKASKETGALYIKSIEITYSTANLETTTLTLTAPNSPISIGDTYTSTPTLKAGEQTLSDKTITWSSDNDKVATVDAATGTVTGVAAGNAKITATFAGDEVYKTSTASYEIKVKGAPELSFPQTSYTIEMGDAFSEPTLQGLPTDVTAKYSSSNADVATVDESTGKVQIVGVGTTTIKAVSEAKDVYEAAEASYVLTVNRATSKKETFDLTSGYENKKPLAPIAGKNVTLNFSSGSMWYAEGTALRFYGDETLTITANSRIKCIEFVYGDTKDYPIDTNKLEFSSGKYDITKHVWDFSGEDTKTAMLKNKKGSKQIRIQKIIVTTDVSVGTISIATSEGFGTYYNSNSYILPEGLTAFGYREANTDGTLVKTEEFTGGDVVPANAALVVKGNTGNYECYATDQVATKTLEGNLLKGVAKATTVEKAEGFKRYVLTTVNNVLGFYRTKSGNIKVPANRAYLELTEAQAQAVSFFQLDGETTGIENATTTTKEAPKAIYTLSGVRLKATTTQGLPAGAYVVNGKVVIVK